MKSPLMKRLFPYLGGYPAPYPWRTEEDYNKANVNILFFDSCMEKECQRAAQENYEFAECPLKADEPERVLTYRSTY